MWFVAFALFGSNVVRVPLDPRGKPNINIEWSGAIGDLVRDPKSAAPRFLRLAKILPKDPRVLFALGRAERAAGRIDDALRTFQSAADVSVKADGIHAARAWYAIARLHAEAGRTQDAATANRSFLWRAREIKELKLVVQRVEGELKSAATPQPKPALKP